MRRLKRTDKPHAPVAYGVRDAIADLRGSLLWFECNVFTLVHYDKSKFQLRRLGAGFALEVQVGVNWVSFETGVDLMELAERIRPWKE